MSQVIVNENPLKRKYTEDMGATIIQRKYKKRKARGPVVSAAGKITRSLKQFPREMRVKLKYASLTPASVPSGTTGFRQAYRCNSVYDPDPNIGGISAYGFAQWSQFYQRYTVVASSATIRVLDKDTGTGVTGTVTGLYGISLRDSQTPSPSPTYENLICDVDSVHKGYDTYHANQTLTKKFDAAKYFGCKNIMDNVEYSGGTGTTLGSNPAVQSFFYCWMMQAPDAPATAQSFMIEVVITYDVVFSQPADLPN